MLVFRAQWLGFGGLRFRTLNLKACGLGLQVCGFECFDFGPLVLGLWLPGV